MAGRKITKMQLTVLTLKILYPLSSVPAGSIDPKIDDFPFETYPDALKNRKKPSVLPRAHFIIPCSPSAGATHPKRFSRF